MRYEDIPIMMYHEISEVTNPWCVSPKNFEEQMNYLKEKGYKTINLSELKKGIEENKESKDNLVVITFDDAREGVYTFAYSILKRMSFRATVFVVPDWIEGRNIPSEEDYSLFMSWNEIKKLFDEGFEIGSHSLLHKNLVKLNKKELVYELTEPKEIIMEKLGGKVKHFCYPYGVLNDEVLKEVKKRYELAVGIGRGFGKKEYQYARQWIMNDTQLDIFAKSLKRPMISLCMIVKNEEKFLEKCLSSVKGLVDEIIIVDTGSDDKTKEIARRFEAKIFDFEWGDDFSAARNESLKQATGDWILVLDADEIIIEEEWSKMLGGVNEWDVSGFRLLTRNYSNDSAVSGWKPCLSGDKNCKSFLGWHPSIKTRLFQNKGFKFEGFVHEMVDKNIEKAGGEISLLKVLVHHYGELKPKEKGKYVELTKQKIKKDPNDAKAYFELGVQYKEVGELELAENNFRKSLELDVGQIIPTLNLAIVQQKQGKYDPAVNSFEEVLKKDDKNAEAYFGLGFCYFKKGDLEKASENFESAIKNNPSFMDAYVNLGAIYERLNRFKEAIDVLEKVVSVFPNNGRAHYNLGVAYEKLKEWKKVISCYQKAIDFNYVRKAELAMKIEKIKSFLSRKEGLN